MQRIDRDVGQERERGDQDERADRLAAFGPLGPQEGTLDLRIGEALQQGPDRRLLLKERESG